MNYRLLFSILAINLVFLSNAFAQDSVTPEYTELIRQAVDEFEARRFDEARSLFRRAHEINPNARTLRGLGIASYEASDYVSTIEYLQQALEDERNPLTNKQQKEAKQVLSKAHGFVGKLNITLTPSDARLRIDGVPTELKENVVLVNPGERTLIATAEGYKTLELDVTARSGTTTDLDISLESISDSEPNQDRSTAPAAIQERDSSSMEPLVPYIVMGAGGALLIGSLITGLLTEDARDELLKKCNEDYNCEPSLESTANRGEALRTTTYILAFTGVAAVATGFVLMFLLDDEKEEGATQTVSLACGPEGCVGSFRQPF